MTVLKIPYLIFQLLFIGGAISYGQTTARTAGIITTLAGTGTKPGGFSGDGLQAFNATLNHPFAMALDLAGNVYITDTYNNRIRKVAKTTNNITTIAGTGTAGFSGDGGAAANAQLNQPTDICIDQSGDNIYFVDSLNYRVRKINIATGIITTVAGNGGNGYAGQPMVATNACIGAASGLAAYYASALYISLGASGRICKLEFSTGLLATFAGLGIAGFSGDGGPASLAAFNYPSGLAVNNNDELFVADYYNHRIRKIDRSGLITTVAGTGVAGYAADDVPGHSAPLSHPRDVYVDKTGNIIIADKGNHRVREVHAKTGKIYTVAGSGVPGFAGDGAYSNTSCVKLFSPTFAKTDGAGNLYVADWDNNVVRKVNNSSYVHIGFQMASAPTDTFITCESRAGISYGWGGSGLQNALQSVQFYVNGNPVAMSGSIFLGPVNTGDIVTADFSFYTNCSTIKILSDPAIAKVLPDTDPDITIATSSNNICTPAPVTFTATTVDAGANPTFTWHVNGNTVSTGNATFTSNTLVNGDQVRCILKSNELCKSKPADTSNVIEIIANPTVTPSVSITANAINLCIGENVTFSASATKAGNNPSYQWTVNGVNVGSNSATFTTSSLQNSDTVLCIVTIDTALQCATSNTVASNKVVVTVANVAPAVDITASSNNVCEGTDITFTAMPRNAGNTVSYQWKVNGLTVGSNSSVYSTNSLKNSDAVSCTIAAANSSCPATSITSNIISMTIYAKPVIVLSADSSLVAPGGQAKLTATVTGSFSSYNWTPASLLVNSLTLTPTTKPLNTTTNFSLSVTNAQGCTNIAHITIQIPGPLLMPSAFTPNSDGKNELFRIPPVSALTLTDFSIYNRLGQKIFTTKDVTKGWDGKILGTQLQTGVFIYTITGVYEGKPLVLKGSFVLIR